MIRPLVLPPSALTFGDFCLRSLGSFGCLGSFVFGARSAFAFAAFCLRSLTGLSRFLPPSESSFFQNGTFAPSSARGGRSAAATGGWTSTDGACTGTIAAGASSGLSRFLLPNESSFFQNGTFAPSWARGGRSASATGGWTSTAGVGTGTIAVEASAIGAGGNDGGALHGSASSSRLARDSVATGSSATASSAATGSSSATGWSSGGCSATGSASGVRLNETSFFQTFASAAGSGPGPGRSSGVTTGSSATASASGLRLNETSFFQTFSSAADSGPGSERSSGAGTGSSATASGSGLRLNETSFFQTFSSPAGPGTGSERSSGGAVSSASAGSASTDWPYEEILWLKLTSFFQTGSSVASGSAARGSPMISSSATGSSLA